MDLTLITNLLYVLGILIITYIAHSIKSYLEQKGKDLATKQDLKTITNITESIKSEYTNKNEEIKKEIELKFDSMRSHVDLINEIDRVLIRNLIDLIKICEKIRMLQLQQNESLIDKLQETSIHISAYQFRYEKLTELMQIKKLSLSITKEYLTTDLLSELRLNITKSLSYFIPPFIPNLTNER